MGTGRPSTASRGNRRLSCAGPAESGGSRRRSEALPSGRGTPGASRGTGCAARGPPRSRRAPTAFSTAGRRRRRAGRRRPLVIRSGAHPRGRVRSDPVSSVARWAGPAVDRPPARTCRTRPGPPRSRRRAAADRESAVRFPPRGRLDARCSPPAWPGRRACTTVRGSTACPDPRRFGPGRVRPPGARRRVVDAVEDHDARAVGVPEADQDEGDVDETGHHREQGEDLGR